MSSDGSDHSEVDDELRKKLLDISSRLQLSNTWGVEVPCCGYDAHI